MDWYFLPHTLQYLVGGTISSIVTIIVFVRNPKNIVSRIFLAFGILTTLWMFSVLAARNAPSEDVSIFLYRIIILCFFLTFPLLLLTLLSIIRFQKIYILTLIPGVVYGIIASVFRLYTVTWTNHGWSYSLLPVAVKIGYPIITGYFLGVVLMGLFLMRKSPSQAVSRKYMFIILGCVLFFVPLTITNNLMWKYPWIFPIGGILLTIEFLAIAYAISLPSDKILITEPISRLSEVYIRFISRIQAKIPGQELGESSFRFQEYIEAMGLEGILLDKSGTLIFEVDKLTEENIKETPDHILRVIKEHPWAAGITRDFKPILLRTYKLLQTQSEHDANEWLAQLLQDHGGYLIKHEMLTIFSEDAQLPAVFTELRPGHAYLFKEDTPTKAYEMLKEAESYGVEALCITKLSPQTVSERYGLYKASILWVTFEKAESTITPKDAAGLTRNVSEYLMKPNGAIILLDCFDQLKFANGFERSVHMLRILRALSLENKPILFVSIPPTMFEKEELVTIEKELTEGMP
jgi:hypothetical protein